LFLRFGHGTNRAKSQPFRKRNFFDLKATPLHTFATLSPAIWRTVLLRTAIMPQALFIFHDHRKPHFGITSQLNLPASVSD
ncbi:MAG: hypothetical protein KAX99_09680, partial [Azonexus sp.]|nr:hypothetical protein [Azonexus sp.]